MAQISLIKKSDIENAERFDAEYFKPEYLDLENNIKNNNYSNFSKYIEVLTDGKHGGVTFTSNGVLFIRNNNINNGLLNIDNRTYISKEESDESKRAEITSGDILLTTIGTIGDSVVVPDNIKQANINQNLVKIRVKKSKTSSILISIFLNSKYGKFQTKRLSTGNVQPLLNYPRINNILIPEFSISFQLKIEKIVKQAHEKQQQAKELYSEAEQILLKELDLLDFKPKNQLSFSATKSNIENAERFDSEYFQPKYSQIIGKITNYHGGCDSVKNIVIWKKGIEVGSDKYTENGKDFVRVSDFSINGIDSVNKKIDNEYFAELKNDFQAKRNEILFTKDGTIGISYLLKNDIDGVVSSAFLRLTLQDEYNNFAKECLTLILNSIICKQQIEQLSGGAIIAHLKPSDFEKLQIPLITKSIQTTIADKITLSHKLRQESKELLELAKLKVEQEIEKTNI